MEKAWVSRFCSSWSSNSFTFKQKNFLNRYVMRTKKMLPIKRGWDSHVEGVMRAESAPLREEGWDGRNPSTADRWKWLLRLRKGATGSGMGQSVKMGEGKKDRSAFLKHLLLLEQIQMANQGNWWPKLLCLPPTTPYSPLLFNSYAVGSWGDQRLGVWRLKQKISKASYKMRLWLTSSASSRGNHQLIGVRSHMHVHTHMCNP